MPEQSQQQQPPVPPYPPPYYAQKRKSNWWIPVVIIGVVLILFIGFIFAVFGAIGSSFESKEVVVKSNSVLYLRLGGQIDEYAKSNPFSFLGSSKSITYPGIIHAIKTAKYDDNIKGIYYNASMSGIGFAKATELQEVLADFKESGKFIYAFIEAGRESEYFNALPADSIFMPKEGIMEMNGYGISSLFMKGLFNKIGIEYHVDGFEDFKSAGESFSRNNFSDSSRYQLEVLIQQRYGIFLDKVSEYREMDREMLNAAIGRGIYTADSLLELGFIDGYMLDDEVREMMKKRVFGDEAEDKKLKLVSVGKYLASDLPVHGTVASKDTQIAMVYGVGPIMTGSPDDNPFSQDKTITPKEFIKNLNKARDDDNVKAIILRIDSPGGSVIASDDIQEAILKAKEVKPIYASMSDVAASGGYYISMPCDTIIAHPATITGSIGVILAIPNLSGLLDMLDVTVDTISTSPNAHFLNGYYPYKDEDKAKLHKLAEGIYHRFLNKVAKYRGMTFDEVRSIAKGRVWTGEDALKIGIVDVLGGYQESLKIAKRRIGIPDTQKVYVRIFPEPEDEFLALLRMLGIEEDNDNGDVVYNNKLADALGISPNLITETINGFPEDLKQEILYFNQLLNIAEKEKIMMAIPQRINVH